MYNEEFKKEYLQLIANTNTLEQRKNVFHILEKYEEFIGKDLYEFTREDLLELLQKLAINGESYDSMIRKRAVINDYREWCAQKQHVVVDAANIDSKTIREVIEQNSRYLTEVEIMSLAQKLENSCDKFLLLAPFYGIGAKDKTELLKLTAADFDLNSESITLYNGRTLKVPSHLCTLGIESANTYERFNRQDGRRFPLHGDGVIKAVRADALASRFLLKRRMDDISLALEQDITFYKITMSGVLHYTKLSMAVAHTNQIREIYLSEFFEQNVKERYGIHMACRTFLQKYGVLV